MVYSVRKDSSGQWGVFDENGDCVESGLSNSAAWRRVDVLSGDTLNKKQDTSHWLFNKRLLKL